MMKRPPQDAPRAARGLRAARPHCYLENLESRLLLTGLLPSDGDSLALAPAAAPTALPQLATVSVPPTVRVTTSNRGKAAEAIPPAKSFGHFIFTRTGSTADALPVCFDLDPAGTAAAGDDFQPLGSSIIIPSGKSSFSLDLIPVDDSLAESFETVILKVRDDPGYVIDSVHPSATITIADNEPIVKITSSSKPSETDPAGRGKIRLTISRSGGNTKLALDVHLTLTGPAAPNVDFVAPPDPITIPATKKSVTIDLPVIDDSDIEGPESVTFALADSAAYHIDAKKPAVTLAIADNEPYLDLRVTSANLSSKTLNLNASKPSFKISATILNLGTVAAEAFPVHFCLVDTANASHTVDLPTYTLSRGLKARQSTRMSLTIPVSALAAAPATGTYQLQACADDSALPVVELNASDNTLIGTSVMQVYDSAVSASTLRFHRATVTDNLLVNGSPMIGGTAATYLVPTGWNFTGSVFWRANPTAPASLDVRVSNPNTLDAVQIFPPGQFAFGGPLGGSPPFSVGDLYYGNEIQPIPADVLTLITQIVIPRLRPGISYTVVSQEETPLYAQAVRAEYPANSTVTAGRVRIEYDVNGQTVEEDFYCALSIMPIAGTSITYWGADRPLALRAAKGQLDSHAALLMTIAQSETIDLHWYNKYSQLIQIMLTVQLQNIQLAGQLSQYISQTSNEILDSSMDAYWARSAAEDQIHESFTQYIQGASTYYDSDNDRNFIFPGYYEDAWVNNLGDYVLSDNANYNPNVSLGGSWQKLTRQ
jgi:hypothetical protein